MIVVDSPINGTTFTGPTANVTVSGRASGPVETAYTIRKNGTVLTTMPPPDLQQSISNGVVNFSIAFTGLTTGMYTVQLKLANSDDATSSSFNVSNG
jgi:hypothetical protein